MGRKWFCFSFAEDFFFSFGGIIFCKGLASSIFTFAAAVQEIIHPQDLEVAPLCEGEKVLSTFAKPSFVLQLFSSSCSTYFFLLVFYFRFQSHRHKTQFKQCFF